jgi:putative transposase
MGRSVGSADELERRRRLAVGRVVDDGLEPAEVAQVLGVARQTVNRWVRERRAGGEDALAGKPHPGRPPTLTAGQEAAVLGWIRRGPAEFGFPDQLWTAPRINRLIEKDFGVRFNDNYHCAWLARRRITPQKPQRVAAERNQRRIRYWMRTTWPRLQKKPPTPAPPSS